ncbi:hypothetical protein Tco_0654729 [Tanacetum coccineum]|uniref:Uncharacterized protein n=1 Tax=Tanacetum coccineum TaxID=301880 RepID=A0ABQ4X4M6_9ASTR
MFVPTGSTLPTLQTIEDLQGDELFHYDAEIELMNLILLSIPNEIYNSVDACTTAKEMWKRVECLMRGTIQNHVDRETHFTNEFDQFVAEPGEARISVYNRFAQLMNDLERNKMIFPIVTVNTKFLNILQPEWLKYVTQLENSHDLLALVAHTGSSSRNTSFYYVTHPTFMVDYDDEYQQDDVQINSKDPYKASAMLNSGNTGRNTRRAYVQEEVVEGSNAQHETRNDEAGVILTDEPYDFLFADALRMEEIEELSANICLMARIQPADNTSDDGPSYDSAFISEECFILGPEALSVDDIAIKTWFRVTRILITSASNFLMSQKLYLTSSLSKSEIPLNVRDTEDTLDDAFKSQQKMKEK